VSWDETGAWAETGPASKAEQSSENTRRRIGPSSGGCAQYGTNAG